MDVVVSDVREQMGPGGTTRGVGSIAIAMVFCIIGCLLIAGLAPVVVQAMQKALILIVCFERDMKNKSHPKVTFKRSSVDQVLLPALSGVVKTYVLTMQR